jgi:hypothetical protein
MWIFDEGVLCCTVRIGRETRIFGDGRGAASGNDRDA